MRIANRQAHNPIIKPSLQRADSGSSLHTGFCLPKGLRFRAIGRIRYDALDGATRTARSIAHEDQQQQFR